MVQLVPVSEESFRKFIDHEIKDYADEKIKAGNWKPEEALSLSEKEFRALLPEGRKTKDQYIMSIMDSDKNREIGVLWYGIRDSGDLPGAFIWDFIIYDEYRGMGFGKESLKALEEELKGKGVDKLSLHVFGHNRRAISLYEKAGFEVTNIVMSKTISRE